MIPEKMKEVLQHEGVVAIATQGPEGPHLVNTWNSYLQLTEADTLATLLVPMGGMNTTEANLRKDARVLMTVGAREVEGTIGPGAGFLIRGTAKIITSGPGFARVKDRFTWARAALEITIASVEQTI